MGHVSYVPVHRCRRCRSATRTPPQDQCALRLLREQIQNGFVGHAWWYRHSCLCHLKTDSEPASLSENDRRKKLKKRKRKSLPFLRFLSFLRPFLFERFTARHNRNQLGEPSILFHPEGMPESVTLRRNSPTQRRWAAIPSGMEDLWATGDRWCRCAQPPANGCDPCRGLMVFESTSEICTACAHFRREQYTGSLAIRSALKTGT